MSERLHRPGMTLAAALLVALGLGWAPPNPDSAPATPAPAPATPAARPSSLPEGSRVLRDVTYAKVDDRELKLDLYLPPGSDEKDAPARPVVIWLHGGGWELGNKSNAPAPGLLARGYAVASVQYRLSNVAKFPAQIHDCKGAVRWLRAHAAEHHLDPRRVGVWGASAGGHLAALLGASGGVKELEGDVGGNTDQSSRVQAVVDWFGPTDMVALVQPPPAENEQQEALRSMGLGMVERFLGGKLADQRAVYEQASPVTHVTPDDPPMLIMHGDKDQLVPLKQSEVLEAKLKAAGVKAQLEVVKGAGHGTLGRDGLKRVADWLDENLKAVAPVKPKSETK